MNIIKELENLKLEHYTCDEDGWYSCPLSKDGCLDDNEEKKCNCGADKHNAKVDKIIEYIKEEI